VATQLLPKGVVPGRRWNPSSPALPRSAPSVLLLHPPYEVPDLRPALPGLNGSTAAPGSIIGVQLSCAGFDVAEVKDVVRDLSRQAPSCPVVVLLRMAADDGVLAAARLAPAGFRAVVPIGPSMPGLLRDALTDPATLARDVIEWLQAQSIRLNPNQVYLLERIITAAPEHAEVSRLLAESRLPESSSRFRLRKRGLPPPVQWFQLARALHAALRLQARPELSVLAVASQFGFADHSAVAHLLRRCFGTTATEIRDTLGWEWLLHRWLASKRLVAC
jgi:AraC-like DNA-binding protein